MVLHLRESRSAPPFNKGLRFNPGAFVMRRNSNASPIGCSPRKPSREAGTLSRRPGSGRLPLMKAVDTPAERWHDGCATGQQP